MPSCTPLLSSYQGDISGTNFDLIIKLGSKSSSIFIGGDRQEEEARRIYPNEKSLVVICKELLPLRPVLSLNNINISQCNAQHIVGKPQNIRNSVDKRRDIICAAAWSVLEIISFRLLRLKSMSFLLLFIL